MSESRKKKRFLELMVFKCVNLLRFSFMPLKQAKEFFSALGWKRDEAEILRGRT